MKPLALLLIVGCTEGLPGPKPSCDGGCSDGAVTGCHGLDENACAAASARGCRVFNCCGSYNGCLEPNEASGCICASCHGFDESTCAAQAGTLGCHAYACCNKFISCLDPGESKACTLACTMPACNTLTDATSCSARSDCHAVYLPGNACGCAPAGCCTFFSSCADGGKANCAGTVTCRAAPPACEGPYVLSYAANCYEGCVLSSECAP
jgi:hypothetical protein